MVITDEVTLPTEEELTVPEVNLSSAALRAGAFHLGKHCEKQNLVSFTGIRIHIQMLSTSSTLLLSLKQFVRFFTYQNRLLCNFEWGP